MPALHAEGLDVGGDGLGDPQPVQRQKRDQRALRRGPEPGGDQQRPELVAVQADGAGFVVQVGAADIGGR